MVTGGVRNLYKGKSGRKLATRMPDNVKKAIDTLQRSPNLQRLSQELDGSKMTAHILARTDGRLIPYKVSVHQELTAISRLV